MPLDGSRSDGPRQFILMFFPTFIVEMDFVGGSDSNSGVDGNIRDCNPDDLLIIAFEFANLSL